MKHLRLFENYDHDPEADHTVTLDLRDYEKAKAWAQVNLDEYENDDHDERVREYVERYAMYYPGDEVELYRMVMLDSFEDLDVENVGIYWSFERSGAGYYGGSNRRYKKVREGKPFTLTGTVQVRDIDWEHGFVSYLYYGDEQWECALRDESPVKITHVNQEALSAPINGTI